MNKFAILSVLLMAGMVAACEIGVDCVVKPAQVDIRVELGTTGVTSYAEEATIAGYNYHPLTGSPRVMNTADILQNVNNDGTLYIEKQVTSTGQWELQEDAFMTGSGTTDIMKQVTWWTDDKTISRRTGDLKYPTVANIYSDFVTPYVYDAVNVTNTANVPPAQTVNYLNLQYTTTQPYMHTESVGINMPERCNVLPPAYPVPPTCAHCPID